MALAYLEKEKEEEAEASPFLIDRQPARSAAAAAALRAAAARGPKAGLALGALLACGAVAALLRGVHRGSATQPRTFLGFDGLLQEVGTSDNASSNGTANGTANATETCPDGYAATHLDMQNHDADMHEETASLDECAAKCSADAECKGFEHNLVAQHCWVSRVGHHCTDAQHEDWISCVKGDSDSCEGGGTSEAPSSNASSSGSSPTTSAAAASPDASPATEGSNEASPDTVPSTESCPDGYVGTQLDMLNEDADMIQASLEDCAAKCSEDEKCKGFEHNMASQVCWVSRAGHHCTDEQHEDWISCVKGDTDACEDGGPNDE